MISTIPADLILSELVQYKQDILWCWWPSVTSDQAPGAHTPHPSHTREKSQLARAAWPGQPPSNDQWGSKVQVWGAQSGGQRPGYCLLTLDMSWHYYRDKASWREYCPLCGSVMWIFTDIPRTSSNLVILHIVIRLWPLTRAECLHRSRWIMDSGGVSQFLRGPIIVCSQARRA